MGTITAPYNFVPLNKYVYCPDWAGQVSQDIPFSDGEDGYIEVTWRNVSPLCIRDASAERGKDKGNSYYSMHIKQSKDSRLYFLPGSSLRGMLRNTLNIMSFGKMVQYDDRFFGHREFNTIGREEVGWLGKEGEKYYLYPCNLLAINIPTIPITTIESRVPGFDGGQSDKEKSAWERNKRIIDSFKPKKQTSPKGSLSDNEMEISWEGFRLEDECYFPVREEPNGKKYALCATGKFPTKLHEWLIPVETKGKELLEGKVVESFFTIYKTTPLAENFLNLLEEGKKIPVTYISDGDTIQALGMSSMLRYPYKNSVSDLVKKGQEKTEGKRDLSELIFGWVDEESKSHMKGRVQISNAFCTKTIKDDELREPVEGVLGEPKPSFYPLYVKQTENGPYRTYEDGEGIAGRKLYRIHKGNSGVKLPQGNGNSSVMSHFIPIPAGQKFVMRINVHNLRKVEIGALLSAITFHKTSDVYHNIGSAKGYGYGKLKCLKCTLFSLKYSEEEYLNAFEQEMSNWAREEWNKTEAVEHLLAIASEHGDDCLRMMEMDKYLRYSQNTNFSRLTEELKPSCSFLTEEERRKREEIGLEKSKLKFKDENRTRYEEVRRLKDEGNYARSLQTLNSLITELNRKGLDTTEEDTLLREIERLQENAEKNAREAEKLQREKDKQEMLDKGLLGYLEDTCKVKTWKVCKDRLDKKWLKARGTTLLCEEEDKKALEKVIRRLFQTPDKKECQEWKKPYEDSKIWKQIAEYLGDERAQNLYNELKG